ncbi:MAG: DUF6285 domain-containing protein [Acidimicrobiia bacterium]|nr:DUF6285 domain-containing protein [Acidimicrobiia bacterium]
MIDRPDAHRLLNAVADALAGDVVSALSSPSDPDMVGAARYTARIAANLCRILAREAVAGPEAEASTVADLRALLGREDGSLEELTEALDELLRSGAADLDQRQVHRVLAADVERRLAIARPSYRIDADRGSMS